MITASGAVAVTVAPGPASGSTARPSSIAAGGAGPRRVHEQHGSHRARAVQHRAAAVGLRAAHGEFAPVGGRAGQDDVEPARVPPGRLPVAAEHDLLPPPQAGPGGQVDPRVRAVVTAGRRHRGLRGEVQPAARADPGA